jgi:hypothetical protein
MSDLALKHRIKPLRDCIVPQTNVPKLPNLYKTMQKPGALNWFYILQPNHLVLEFNKKPARIKKNAKDSATRIYVCVVLSTLP